jgi:siroheme synthase
VALISHGTTDRQQVVCTTLGGLPDDIGARAIPTPAMAVIGEVAALAGELAWFQPDGSAQSFVPFEDEA